MRSSGVHHVDLVVSSIERSLPFYRDLLGPLGFHRIGEVEGERGETIWYLSGAGGVIGLREAQTEGDYDRYRVGLHHLAFDSRAVPDRQRLDRIHDAPSSAAGTHGENHRGAAAGAEDDVVGLRRAMDEVPGAELPLPALDEECYETVEVC